MATKVTAELEWLLRPARETAYAWCDGSSVRVAKPDDPPQEYAMYVNDERIVSDSIQGLEDAVNAKLMHRVDVTSIGKETDLASALIMKRNPSPLTAEELRLANETGDCPRCGKEIKIDGTHERDSSMDRYSCPRCWWKCLDMDFWDVR